MRTVSSLTLIALSVSLVAADVRLNAAIRPPNPVLYRSVRNARDWQNPIIFVLADGVDVRAAGITGPGGNKHVAVADLKTLLVSLPVSAWPYGRIIMQADQHILPSPPGAYLRRMSRTREHLAVVLKDLDITADLWP